MASELRKFEVLSVVDASNGMSGPDRMFYIEYRAIKNKEWITGKRSIIARNIEDAKIKAQTRWGGKIRRLL